MITITRRQARELRSVFRRSVLGISHRGQIPPLVFQADGSKLRAQHRYGALAVEHVLEDTSSAHETISLPLDLLPDVAGREETPIVLEAAAQDRTVVRWQDRGIPQVREYKVVEPAKSSSFPDSPATFATAPAGLLETLEEASRTTAEDSNRYALSCLQMRGQAGQLAATDGRQLLIGSGFDFPWNDDVLVRRSPIFACRELRTDSPVELGRTDAHVVIRVGSWTIFLEIQKEARFPHVEDVLPAANSARTRLELAADDAQFLSQAIDRLPGSHEHDAPVTFDLNGRVVLRARSEEGRSTELVLSRSSYSGDPVRLVTNRQYLARAVRLGLRSLEITSPHEPVACRDEHRAYGWQPLNPESAIEPSEDAICVDSASSKPTESPKEKPIMNGSPAPSRRNVEHTAAANGTVAAAKDTTAPGLASVIQEAEALYQTLGQAKAQTRTLVAALRRHRRQSKLVANTLASLRQLQLQETAK
ncbi:MAG TPA: hypothetical protein VGZ22_28525 [Isosphaeraceae bacterium]|nr:hypothetical protein [Isosphaeraceae bacterium]